MESERVATEQEGGVSEPQAQEQEQPLTPDEEIAELENRQVLH